MKKIIVFLFCAQLFILFGAGTCIAFRCGNGLVSTGASKSEVLLECGQPTSKEKSGAKKAAGKLTSSETTDDKKTKSRKKNKKINKESSSSIGGKYDKAAKKGTERWYYNCGENDFIYVLTFEGNILKKEDTEGYGKGKSDCKGKGK
jgi:hypothetical protein